MSCARTSRRSETPARAALDRVRSILNGRKSSAGTHPPWFFRRSTVRTPGPHPMAKMRGHPATPEINSQASGGLVRTGARSRQPPADVEKVLHAACFSGPGHCCRLPPPDARARRPQDYSMTPQETRAPPPPRAAGWSEWLSPPAWTMRARPLMSPGFRRGASTGCVAEPFAST